MKGISKPPRLAVWLLELFGDHTQVNNILGDLHELYERRLSKGIWQARLFYWLDTFSILIHRAIPEKKYQNTYPNNFMELTKSYLKVAFRNLFRHKTHTLINTLGLSTGLTFFLMMLLFITHELSFNNFHLKKDQIYLLPMTWHFNGTDMPTGANCSVGGPFMKESFPEVIDMVRISSSSLSLLKSNEAIKESSVYYADSSFLKIFTFPLIEGNPNEALVEPYSIVLTEKSARKYFGDNWREVGIVGQTLTTTNNKVYKITGVVAEIPSNTHLQFDFVVSFSTLPISRAKPSWDNSEFYTYLLLDEKANVSKVIADIPSRLEKAFSKDILSVIELDLVPFSQVYLNNIKYRVPGISNILYVKIFSVAALLILLIATVNYINMATARSLERALEVGIRKVMGAQRMQLFIQFFGESVIVTSISFLLALAISWLLLPLFNSLSDKSLNLVSLFTLENASIAMLALFMISFVSGFYPALFISNYKPALVLKGKMKDSMQGIRLRRALVIAQFLISGMLLICTLMMSQQISFMQDKSLGFDRKKLVSLALDSLSRTRIDQFRNVISSEPSVQGMAASVQLPTTITHQTALSLANETDSDRKLMNAVCVNSEFVNTVGLEVISGRGFTPGVESNSETWEIILNESAANFFGWSAEESIEKRMIVWQNEGVVVGVIKDFHFSSLHNPIAPLVIFSGKNATFYNHILVNMEGDPNQINATLSEAWKKTNPDSPFTLTYLDDQYESLYRKEARLKRIVNVFAILAILISNLGLFGLASYAVLQRTKELSIRKVLGASVGSLISLVTGNFIKMILVSFLLAVPVSWYLMNEWLSGFAYHISFNWWIVIGSGLMVIVLALATIVQHSLRAATVNPAENLKTQ